jgi:hypothetical protein
MWDCNWSNLAKTLGNGIFWIAVPKKKTIESVVKNETIIQTDCKYLEHVDLIVEGIKYTGDALKLFATRLSYSAG